MSRRTRPLPLRGTAAHARAESARHAKKAARPRSVSEREALLRTEAREDPNGLLLRIRRSLDDQILQNKRDLVAQGLHTSHVLAVVVNPRREDVGDRWIGTEFFPLARQEILDTDFFPDDDAGRSLRASLERAPRDGHVWVWTPIPGARMLVEEPVEHRVPDPDVEAAGVVAAAGGEA